MLLDELRVHLRDVAEQVAARVERILTNAAHFRLESREAVGLFGKTDITFVGDMLDERQRLETDPGAVLAIIGHSFPDKVRLHVQGAGKRERIERLNVPGSHDDVVAHFIANQDLSVAVIDNAAWRVNIVVDQRVIVGVPLVFVVDDLDIEELGQQNECNDQQADHQTVFAV